MKPAAPPVEPAPFPRFYQIVDRAAWLERLLPCGLRFVQIRVKDLPETDLRAEIAQALRLCEAHGATLVVNDYWRLAIELGCSWVHLGQEDLDAMRASDLTALRDAGVKLGVSTHDDAELNRAMALAPDYVALGPIYPTVLKAMRFAPQGLERIGVWKRRIGDIPLVAIGGMSVERATGAYDAGADCVSVVTDVLRHTDPEARLAEWLAVSAAP